ncbi:MAG: bifunctional adenosylcobinamide kinase/adenosylcobinamide-phosphate guanylyltransferase [Actinomycetota bacterium]|nr:bifunctional adenosylcobinamide kinase/adenosylcobinamide-phosphate guanylyltransferase [Actinomycetota bacterium]
MALVVITGGARSGKSSVAQRLAKQVANRPTVVVFGSGESDPEMARRIERHRADRPEGWVTVEATDSVEWTGRVPEDGLLVVDCLGTLLSHVMAEVAIDLGSGESGSETLSSAAFEDEVEHRFAALVGWMVKRWNHTLIVTNEVGAGVVPAHVSGRVFRDVLGRANRSLTDRADAAYLVVAGRCIQLTTLPCEPRWPGVKGRKT